MTIFTSASVYLKLFIKSQEVILRLDRNFYLFYKGNIMILKNISMKTNGEQSSHLIHPASFFFFFAYFLSLLMKSLLEIKYLSQPMLGQLGFLFNETKPIT